MLAIELQTAQSALDALKVHAHTTDHELATAVRPAVGEAPSAPTPGGAPPQGQQPKPHAGQPPKSLQDMLLAPGSGNGAGAGEPVPAGAGSGKPPSLQDMLLGKGTPADEKPPPGSLPDLLSRMPKPGGAPRSQPTLADEVNDIRDEMLRNHVPPDEVEARLNAMWATSQQWVENGVPSFPAPAPSPPPPRPGFGDGFADHWFGFEQSVHDLTGQEGLERMGDAWGGMVKGLGQKAEEFLRYGPTALSFDDAREVQSFLDNPAYFAGGKAADAAIAVPGMMFGPEGAGLEEASAAARASGLGDLDGAAGVAHDLPGVHPSLTPLEQPLTDLHSPGSAHEPPSAGSHSVPEQAERSAVAGHPMDSPEPPFVSGHPMSDATKAPAAAAVGGGRPPLVHAEPPMPGGHAPEPPASGGHPPPGPPDHSLPGAADPASPSIATDSQWAPVGHDQPVTYHGDATQAALDLNDAFQQHHPTGELSQRVADMSTHYIGDKSDRVVLGKWAGDDKGYIGEARGHGGIYYDTSTEVWDTVTRGLDRPAADDLGWEVNEQFLRSQMERGVGRIDYVLNDSGFSSIEELVRTDRNSFSAREIRFLTENASIYGYERVGNSWVRMKGGQS